MATIAEALGRRWPLLGFLREELAPRPGRVAAVARIAISCTLVVFITMLYQVPEPAYAAYIVFFLGRGDQAVTVLTGVVGALGATLATVFTIILYTLDAGEPALRLPVMAASAFVGMFLLRTIKLGPVAFLTGFLLVITQSIIDDIPNTEALIRFIMWLWVVVMIPDVVTVFVNLLAGQNPAQLARRMSLALLEDLAGAIRRGDAPALGRCRAEALELVELRDHAGMLDRDLKARNALDSSLIEIVVGLSWLASLLPQETDAGIRNRLADACAACRDALAENRAPLVATGLVEADLARLEADALPVVVALANALDRLGAGLASRPQAHAVAPKSRVEAFFVPDAFTNPDHARFALKTTIAAMTAYVTYSALAWPGIRTALITCFFVALGSLGETMHKLTLRLSGALIGGLLGGLCIVYLLPRMEDIGDLILLIAAASALFAWVATSTERLAYAGMQMALAFYLGVLQGYGPATDLTVLRDRVAGILLGNLLMSLIFSTVWPVSARAQARDILAAALRKLGALLIAGAEGAGMCLATAQMIAKARQLVAISIFETGALQARAAAGGAETAIFDAVDRIAAQVVATVDQPSAGRSDDHRPDDAAIAAWLTGYADSVATDRPPPVAPAASVAAPGPEAPLLLKASAEARAMLRAGIERIASRAA